MIVIFTLIGSAILAMVGEFIGLKNHVKSLVILLLFLALFFSYSHFTSSFQMLNFTCVSAVFSSILIFLALISIGLIPKSLPMLESRIALFLFSTIGGLILISYTHFVLLFVGIELLSIPLYILAAGHLDHASSREASLKYFLMGSFISALLLFGMALVFYESGSFYLTEIGSYVSLHAASPILIVGFLMIAVSICFKCGLVPFHFWVPDVYEGSPSYVTAYMSTVAKMSAFFALFSLVFYCFGISQTTWSTLFVGIALLSMLFGNLLALRQRSVKRLLAYSSIAHAGFIFLPLALFDSQSALALNFYGLAYGISSFGLFLVIMILENHEGTLSIEGLKGLFLRNKLLAVLATVSLLSLTGIPLTAGFFAKFLVLSIAFVNGHYGIVIFALINAVIGASYYLTPLLSIFTTPAIEEPAISLTFGQKAIAVIIIIATFGIGIYPLFFL